MKTAREYEVTFFKKGEDGKQDELLGRVTVSDEGTGKNLTLVAKAFRVADPVCLLANRVKTTPIRK